MDTKNTKPKILPEMQFSILEQTEKENKMKSQKKMWKDINEPKVEKIMAFFDENGKPILVAELLDRIPIFMRERRKQK